MATPEGVIQKINLLIEDANDATGSLHNNLRDAVDSLILGYGGYGNIEVDSLSELHTWSKYTIGGTTTRTPETNVFLGATKAGGSITIAYADAVDTSSGQLALSSDGYGTIAVSKSTDGDILKGKAVHAAGKYYEIPETANVWLDGSNTEGTYRNLYASEATEVTYTSGSDSFVGIVVSEDSNAYPQNGEQDGYKYVYNGTLGSELSLQHKSVTPSTKNQVVLPDTNYDGLSHVIVEGDEDLVAGNIKNGVEIFGVTGSYVGTGGTALPTLTTPGTAEDLARGKQLIDANGNVVTGSVATYDDYSGWGNITPIQQDEKVRFEQTPGVPMLFRNGFYLGSPLSNFGDASASDVAKGKTFTSQNGLKVVGIHEDDGGVTLPTLTNPASASDMAYGKQLIDANGNVVIGNLNEHTESTSSLAGYLNPKVNAYTIGSGEKILEIKAQTSGEGILRKGAWSHARAPLTEFGDATAADVAVGKTFTSAAGHKVVGTMSPGGDFTVTDDGAGNVTITSSAITDNNGDVVIT